MNLPFTHSESDHSFALMLDYLDGELEADQVTELSQQLRNDQNLRKAFASLVLLRVQLRRLGREAKAQEEMPSPRAEAEPVVSAVTAGWNVVWAHWKWRLLGGVAVLAFAGAALIWPTTCPRLMDYEGPALLTSASGPQSLKRGAKLRPGSELLIGAGAAATIQDGKGTHLRLTREARLRLEVRSGRAVWRLQRGLLDAEVAPRAQGNALRILTPHAELTILGTQFAVDCRPPGTVLEVRRGVVQMCRLDDRQTIQVQGGQSATTHDASLRAEELQGGVLRDVWRGILGSRVGDLVSNPDFPDRPNERAYQADLSLRTKLGDLYGVRLQGWIFPPVAGSYTFWVAADDAAEFYLSTDETAAKKRRICFTPAFGKPDAWDEHPEQASGPIRLEAGRRYYLEVLMKQSGGEEGLAVAWAGPNFSRTVVTNPFLAPVPAAGAVDQRR